ncbi:hypothetical protein [Bradyrhizobium sp. USDA 3256]
MNELDEVAGDSWRTRSRRGQFIFLDNEFKIDKSRRTVMFDRGKTGDLGLNMSDVGGSLATMLGGNVEYFSLDGHS